MKAILAGTKGCGDCRDEAHRARRVDAPYVRIDDDPGVKDGAWSVKARGKETREIALLQIPQSVRSCWKTTERKNYKARIRLLNALLAQPVLPGPVVSKELKITADTLHVMEEQGVLKSAVRAPGETGIRCGRKNNCGKTKRTAAGRGGRHLKGMGRAEPPLPDPRCDGKRQNACLYGADDGASAEGRKTGDRADPGDCADVSERGAVLRTVWNKGHGGQLADDTVRARRPDGGARRGRSAVL